MAIAFLPNWVFVPFSEYPASQKFLNPRIPPTILVALLVAWFISMVVYLWWCEITDGETEIIYLPLGLKEKHSLLQDFRCQNASVKLADKLYSMPPRADRNWQSPNDISGRGELLWSVVEIFKDQNLIKPANSMTFDYTDDDLICNVTSAAMTYHFQETSLEFQVCSSCLVNALNEQATFCAKFDSAISRLPSVARGFYETLVQPLQRRLGDNYRNLTFASSALPIAAFPPDYSSEQADFYGPVAVANRDVSQVSLWLDDIIYVPGQSRNTPESNSSSTPPPGSFCNGTCTQVTSFPDYFIETARAGSSHFQLQVAGIGAVRPLTQSIGLENLPFSITSLYNTSASTLGIFINIAASDLNQRSIGAIHLCQDTTNDLSFDMDPKDVPLAVISCAGVIMTLFAVLLKVGSLCDKSYHKSRPIDREENTDMGDIDPGETLVTRLRRHSDIYDSKNSPSPEGNPLPV